MSRSFLCVYNDEIQLLFERVAIYEPKLEKKYHFNREWTILAIFLRFYGFDVVMKRYQNPRHR